METILWQKEWVTNIEITKLEKPCSEKSKTPIANPDAMKKTWTVMQQSNDIYEERIDCNASCWCGCKDDHVEARVEGGKVCCSCLSKLIIRPAVCSVARSLPAHKTCHIKWLPLNKETVVNKKQKNSPHTHPLWLGQKNAHFIYTRQGVHGTMYHGHCQNTHVHGKKKEKQSTNSSNELLKWLHHQIKLN